METQKLKHLLPVVHPMTTATAFWLSLAGGVIHTGMMLLGNIYTAEQTLDARFHTVLMAVINFLLFFVLFLYNFHIMKRDWGVAKRYFVATLGTLALTALYTLLSQAVNLWLYGERMFDGRIDIDIIKDGVVALTVLLITALLFNITRRQQMTLENEQLQAENIRVRYTSLENQVDPHFLFNSLNTLDGLIGEDDARAHNYLQQLASTYRYIIQQQQQVSLSDELAFADSYIYLMQIRYGSNLTVIRHIDEAFLDAQVVPISLQLLLENAIKHNVISDRHPLTITIATTDHGTLRVSNPRQPKADTPEGAGIGLANLGKRYQLLFHQDISIEESDQLFAVEIPFIESVK